MSREIDVKALKNKLRRYEEALLQIEQLVFHNQSIPLSIRESIQEQVVLKAGVQIIRGGGE
ncbi:hypothetical protein O0555_20960 [Brevibacillus laterosporus]|uniref:hypothetical protein n=1 Tax=Brevibacillus laterosporus TaxID=1465 RepID=UPI00215BDFC6|nr:hypothetical protein [Brevibacillus laterosporus]MCR8939773.1 hypothetical protein [Brevibacillus laterosporus]MCZ0842413.1 hypothetical protein [Brevibacillus laterosporus]MCZ0846410.1 hypothetical protein [Brevibacillus laterosporus]